MTIKGIKKACGDTKLYPGVYGDFYGCLMYDMDAKECWMDEFVGFPGSSWKEYHDPAIVNCGTVASPAKMSELREMVEQAVAEEMARYQW